jgi:hypothetical protein
MRAPQEIQKSPQFYLKTPKRSPAIPRSPSAFSWDKMASCPTFSEEQKCREK